MNRTRCKKAILLAAYGASNFQSKMGLRNFEILCRAKFPAIPVRWAFTSVPIIRRLAMQKQKSDSLRKALMKLAFEKFEFVGVQPLQTIPGSEYEDVVAKVEEVAKQTGLKCHVGSPLLNENSADISLAARAILDHLPKERGEADEIVLMGHGAKHKAVDLYVQLDREIHLADERVHVGAMEGRNVLEEILPRLTSHKVWLMPLLSLTGKHAYEDMAGESRDSWKSRIEARGHQCLPILHGMAEYAGIVEIWLEHLRQAAGARLLEP